VTTTHRPRALVALLAVLALVAVACGGDDGGTASPGGGDEGVADADRCPLDALDAADGPVTVDFWHAMTAENETTLEALAADYNASQDRVRVNVVFQGTYDETADKYLAALRGGDLPSIVQMEETRIQMGIDSRSMLPVQACADAAGYDFSDHLEPVVDQFTVEDVLWPMPFNTSNPVLYYNTRMFERAGLSDDDVPATFEELRAVSQRLVDSGEVRAGFALELSPWYIEQWFAKANEPLVDNDNGRSGRATGTNLDSDIGLEIYTFIDEMMDSGLGMNVGRNTSGIDALLALATEDAGMTIDTSAALGAVFATLESGQFPNVGVGVAPLPGPTGGGVLVGGAALWLVDRGSSDAEKAASWEFMVWLNEPEQQARWHAGTGYIPIRRSAVDLPEVADLWADKPEFRIAYDQLLDSGAAFGGPVVGDYAGLRDAIVESLERLILQDVAPADALAGAKQQADRAIESYNQRTGN
jgi:sn-glycerol 3-phosphate transport system substrate-binding protein